jgi:hypothetical protein
LQAKLLDLLRRNFQRWRRAEIDEQTLTEELVKEDRSN